MQNSWKKALGYVGIVIFFLVLAYGFVPQVLGGKIVNQSDISGYVGMAKEANTWNTEHPDDRTAWTNSMFGGMPTTMLTGNPAGDWTQKIYSAVLFGKRPASYLFISLIGAFLLMLSLGVNRILAVGGAIAVTFCSYNMQIIQVGHNTKMMAIAFLPWVLAAMIFTYKSALKDKPWRSYLPQTLLGAALFAMAVNFQIKADHPQISYYLAIIMFCYVIGLFIWLVIDKERRHRVGRFFVASFLLLFLGLIGIGTNANKLIPTMEYSHQTMRGGSELTAEAEDADLAAALGAEKTDGSKSANQKDKAKSKGLDLDYATSWSYGWEELPNMMIPDFNGGSSSGSVNPSKSATVQLLKQYGQGNAKEIAKALPLYWGPQPFTAGPMYMGAITVFLFVLGLLMCKGREKWWIFAATLIAVFLGVGRHFMPFTEFWYYHVPMYSKFRTVSMALIILQVTLPMLGFIVLDRILRGDYTKDQFKKPGIIALAITGGFCLLCFLLPGIAGTFSGQSDAQMHPEIVSALQEDRRMLLKNDALVSALFIGLTYLCILWAFAAKGTGMSSPKEVGSSSKEAASTQPVSAPKSGMSDTVSFKKDASGTPSSSLLSDRRTLAGIAICALVLINMFAIGKRYLNADHFVTPRAFNGQFAERPVDKQILTDKELDYRVLDLTVNVFNDSHPSYWHKNIGGYSPVKLQRYQDLIERHLTGEINTFVGAVNKAGTMESLMSSFPTLPVLSMLNDKYIILDGNSAPVVNPDAMGNAWFVDNAIAAATPNEEIDLLDDVSLSETLVIGPDFNDFVARVNELPPFEEAGEGEPVSATPALSQDNIELTYYAPNELHYSYSAATDRAVVFSEIYYPHGWTLTIDGNKQADLFRANWILRGAILPAGQHDIVMRFEPRSYTVGSNVARASSATILLFLLLSLAGMFFRPKE